MRHFILILPMFLMACDPPKQSEIRYLRPIVAPETLTPCVVSYRRVETINQLATRDIENMRAAECANGKIETLAKILGPQ